MNQNDPNLVMDRNITTEPSPDIALFHILPRLPLKTAGRLTCVSKRWHSLLTSSVFAKLQNIHQELATKLIVLSYTRPYTFCTIDCERPKDGFTASRPLPFKVEPNESIRILTSVNGLVCVGITKHDYKYFHLILWNPTTGDHKTLSKPPSCYRDCYYTSRSSLFGLYYRSCDDDYKLLRITFCRNVYIYSLKSDSWMEVGSGFQCTKVDYWLTYFWEPNVSLNENIYFLENQVGNTFSVVKFDTGTETLEVIATPPYGNPRSSYWNFIFLKDGCIHLWVNINGDGDWTKVADSSTMLGGPRRSDHRPLHFMRNGDFLMDNYHPRGVYELDIMKTLPKDLCIYMPPTPFMSGQHRNT